MANTECSICVEKYNKTYRSKVCCQYCEQEACRECFSKWILSESTPNCMSNTCNKEWTRQFMSTVFTKVFINTDYKKHKEHVLFEQEQALLPATQPIVENIIKCERLGDEIRGVEREINDAYSRISALRAQKGRLERGINTQVPASERSTFIKACPDQDCRGFLSSQWKCGICEKWVCPDCHEIKGHTRDAQHACNPDNVATALLLANDTKSCPSCGTGIHKLEGCDQMFCTLCHTGFSWKTGKIQTNIHNPHYYEWLRRTGGDADRNPGEIVCGREITHTMTRAIMTQLRIKGATVETIRRLSEICESIIHLRLVTMDRYRVDHMLNNQDLRVAYLRNQISKDELKTHLQREDKKHQKTREINNVLTMLTNTATDIIYRFQDELSNSLIGACDILDEIVRIIEYSNECFVDISRTWGSKLIVINGNLRLHRR